ncbi:hypothetical protein OI70_19000 [Dickeya fangzhongdai]|nr:hypothetical protein OI70_19000 [Dickeya fangzhongdai]
MLNFHLIKEEDGEDLPRRFGMQLVAGYANHYILLNLYFINEYYRLALFSFYEFFFFFSIVKFEYACLFFL